jgi:hypothetical protein
MDNSGMRSLSYFLVVWLALPVFAVDHTQSVGEPYALAGKRMVFTNWFYIRPGQVDWKDASGKSVYQSSEVEAGPGDAKLEVYLAPRGIRLVAQRAQRGDPIIQRAMPWEKMGISGTALHHIDGKYKLYAGSQKSKSERFACYFESTDGNIWARPELGYTEYDGSTKNNLFQTPGPVAYIFFDPHGSDSERYKALWASRTDPKIIAEYRKQRPISVFAEEEDPGRFHSIRAAVSPDGFHWTELTNPLSVEVSDTQIVAYYDEQLKRYVMFTRAQMLGPRATGQGKPEGRLHDFLGRRAIGRAESEDFHAFPLSELIIQSSADMLPTDTYYTNCKTTIPGAPDHHLLFPAVYHQDTDTTSIELWSSDDSRHWTKLPGSPVLTTNSADKWDSGCVFAFPNLVELPDGAFALPYTGYRYPHKYPRGAWSYDVGMAIWPKGRIVALEATGKGEFTTVAFMSPGKTLLINALTAPGGSIKVEVCDLQAKPLPGRSFEDAQSITGDVYQRPLVWKGSDDLGVEPSQPVMLRFQMDQAKLFGIDFR